MITKRLTRDREGARERERGTKGRHWYRVLIWVSPLLLHSVLWVGTGVNGRQNPIFNDCEEEGCCTISGLKFIASVNRAADLFQVPRRDTLLDQLRQDLDQSSVTREWCHSTQMASGGPQLWLEVTRAGSWDAEPTLWPASTTRPQEVKQRLDLYEKPSAMSETETKQAFVFFSEAESCFLTAQDEFPVPVTLGSADSLCQG